MILIFSDQFEENLDGWSNSAKWPKRPLGASEPEVQKIKFEQFLILATENCQIKYVEAFHFFDLHIVNYNQPIFDENNFSIDLILKKESIATAIFVIKKFL